MQSNQTTSINLISGLMLIALSVVWGGSFFFAEIALREVPPLTIALHRVFWAVPALLLIVYLKSYLFPRTIKIWFCYLVMGALNNAIPFSLIFWRQTNMGSGLASILNCMTAFFGVIVSGIFLADERLNSRKIIGALFGVFGVAVIIGFDALTNFDLSNLAQLAILGATISYAFAGVWGKRFLAGQPPIMNACGMLIGSTILLIPMVFLTEGMPVFKLSGSVWASLIAVALLSTALAYLLYFEILVRAGSANLMLVTLLIPPVAIGLSVTFLGEELAIDAIVGFGLITLGLIITDGRLFKKTRLQ